jgi:hypothetical protein
MDGVSCRRDWFGQLHWGVLGGFIYLAGGVLGPSSPCRVPLAGFLGNARFSSLEGGNFVRIPFPVARAFTCPRSPPFGGLWVSG